MNHKQKLGYTLFGAGIMAVGIAIGQFITPNIEAQSNGVFDRIICRELELVDKDGNKAIGLQSNDKSNSVNVYDRQGNVATILGSIDNLGSGLSIYDKQKKLAVGLSSIDKSNGLSVYDRQGNVAVELSSHDEKGSVMGVYDKYGNKATGLSANESGRGIDIYDKHGNRVMILSVVGLH